MNRKTIPPMRRLAIFEKARGICHICGMKIQANTAWDVEHVRPLGLLGDDDEANMAPAHKACHAAKTAIDVSRIAKAKRVKAKHIGIKKRSTWQTKYKRKMDGTVVLR